MYLKYIRDLADILAVYYIVYRLILLLKGTRAMQVIWGVFILAVITAIAQALHLAATVWLMQQFWLAGILLLIVVFQPEIRFALANIGSNPLGRVMVSQEYRFIGEMMEGVRSAMAEKMGMLIVLEQDMALRDIVETGVSINGAVSKELLLTVFHENTLLHDGAAVIANNRLVAAGCILPLTEQQELSKILGMRHRAALGLSEAADAIIVIVSEETGTLSLARNGKLQQNVDPKDLEAMLYQLYRSKAEKTLLRKASRPEAAPAPAAQPQTPPQQPPKA
ncbi:MAG: TIGR00159 family protein [Elusimicrobia bacterium GWA2_62_23]|nr:MAG: TIGR00159 family protein [Elusimicrobia bacterium GWA2_62_23]OGR72386.1 MAG: TIGR00159 family protein [Elusimicrobia bacterium GWC2_63_65]